jgi:8-oxo-dGTP pyrophosphatase MutT (NUDIX family)
MLMKLWRRKVARAFIYDPQQQAFLVAEGALLSFEYHLPGGGIDRGESPEQALRRELEEELNIRSEDITSLTYLHKAYGTVLLIPHEMEIFLVCVKDPQIKKSWEISSIKWMSRAEILQYFPKEVLGNVLAKIPA